jgi:cell surface protein SprA
MLSTFQANAQKEETKDTSALHYPLKDDRQPYQSPYTYSGIQTKPPSNLTSSIEFDPATKQYVFRKNIGKTEYQLPYAMSIQEYEEYEIKNSSKQYWNDRSRAERKTGSSSFSPSMQIGVEAFDKIFGTNTINIVPQGSAELIFGINTSKINNPNISESLRKTTTFDFQEKIQMNVTGSIGDKLKLGVNYNTEATFDYENKTKMEYTGKEDEIIRKIEAGNVTMPLTGSLITGSQSLFGLKTELQFGKLNMVTVVSQQKGESSTIEVKGGAQQNEFEITIDQYEANKHFFLSHYFRDHYEKALSKLPIISTDINITKVEVWVTNKSSNIVSPRNIAAFLDLGESNPYNTVPGFSIIGLGAQDSFPRNEISGLYSTVKENIRTFSGISSYISGFAGYKFSLGKDCEKVENARKLTETEYSLNKSLGYISLNYSISSDEVLAVAFEYTYKGKTYKVGELSTDLSSSDKTLMVKLLKGTSFTPRLPNWDLMMKNVYSINAYQVNKDDFKLNVLYKDDKNGTNINYIPEDQTKKSVLLKVMDLDNLNSQLEAYPDGVFDFIPDVTINASNGRIFFPTLEPFGKTLRTFMKNAGVPTSVINKYVYSELYDSTQTKARQISSKNKFLLKGTYQSSVSSDIALNALNVPEGSVVVTAGGIKLTENVDYTVDYTLGRVKIINQGLLSSGTAIKISLESNSLYSFQTKTFIGTHLDYKFSNNFNLGATILNLTERPLTEKVNIGDEPISNTIWGLNGSYSTSSQFLTTMVDKLPFLETKEPSSFTVNGEFAQLIPGHSKALGKTGTAYIDDFEGSETSIDLKSFSSWSLASTPQDVSLFPEASYTDNLKYGYNRAKLAWYVIDPLFLRNTSATPGNIKNNPLEQSSFFVREVYESQIFKNKVDNSGLETNISVLNLAYYPRERGPYNYDATNISIPDGKLLNPEKRWGGIQRQILTNDFEAANVEYIEFWMMDPFCEDINHNNKGGSLYFDLGNVSEDVLKDSQKSFENGLPTDTSSTGTKTTVWGRVSTSQSIINAFDNDANARKYQDIGLDGLDDDQEKTFFQSFLNDLAQKGVDITNISNDPSSDDFEYFRGADYDEKSAGILERYKKYNGLESNSPALTSTSSDYSPSSSSLPNTEDINSDNTLSETESFYQYKVDIKREKLKVGSNFVVDSVQIDPVTMPDGNKKSVTWYQFRIPIYTDYEKVVGDIEDFTSIRFMRMFLNGFSDSVMLRFARLELVRGDWRKYNLSLRQGGETLSTPKDDDASFEITSVNIEENSQKSPVNYVLPPGVSRQVDPSNTALNELNEQAMVLKVIDLNNGDARVAYKSTSLDIRQYKRLKMDVHAEQLANSMLNDSDLTVFIRIGSDYTENYYEYEVPLKLTPWGAYNNDDAADRLAVWPDENRIDISLQDFQLAKLARNAAMKEAGSLVTATNVYPYKITNQNGKYYVRGYPNISNIVTVMIGIRYPYNSSANGHTRSAEVWVNELRMTDFNEEGGWAANLGVTTKLADFATISVSGSTSTHGFGSLDSKIGNRSTDDVYQYDIASNFELGKFFSAKSGVQIPMYFGISEKFITPQYNPLDPDVELKTTLNSCSSQHERDSILNLVQDYSTHKSLNFTNVRINKMGGKPHFYDVSNWTLNYGYDESYSRNINTERDIEKHYTGGIMYNYQLRPKNVTPFQKSKLLRGNAFRLIRDFNFNYLPTSVSFRTDMNRTYQETKLRNLDNPDLKIDSTVEKSFFWNRYYDMSFDLTKQLKLDFSATNMARIDEPQGAVNKNNREQYQHWKDSIWSNIKRGGRTTNYQHNIRANYNVPVNKLPGLDWTSANLNYSSTYDWTASPVTSDSTTQIGNTISNSGSLTSTGQLNLSSLYNKIPYFRKLLQPQNKANQKKRTKKITFEKERVNFYANSPKSITHKLGSQEIKIKVTDTAGVEIKGKLKIINDNKVSFTTENNYKGAKVLVEATVTQNPPPLVIVAEHVTRAILGIKNISLSWSQSKGSIMPGFMPKTQWMGMSNNSAPGLAFVLGIVDKNFGQKAIDKGWLTTSSYLSTPYTVTSTDNISLRSSMELFAGFKIELTANRTYSNSASSYYSPSDRKFNNYMENGSFSMSFISIGSAFEKNNFRSGKYVSEVFNKFLQNRVVIARRLGNMMNSTINNVLRYDPNNTLYDPGDGGTNGYSLTSQQVLIPAFMSAYGGIDPGKVTLRHFPSVFKMMPNWRVSYDGLSKIPFVKKYARSVSLNHQYKATYNIGSYVSNSFDDVELLLSDLRDLQNNFIPDYDISSISISEQFSPLFSIDINFLNSLTTRMEIKKSRNVVLSLSNVQVTENNTNEFVFGVGYKIKDFNFTVIQASAGKKGVNSDLNLRGDLSLRDNKIILRNLNDDPDQAVSGQKVLTLKLSADYMISDNFNLRMFYDRIVNTPFVSSSYPTATTNFGFSLRFSLAQ